MTDQRLERITSVLHHRQTNLTVVLENVEDPHNISAIFRTCDAVGVQDIYVLNNKIPKHKKWGIRSSRSADKWITVHQYTDTNECISQLRKRYDTILTTHLTENSVSLYQVDFRESIALIFGNEITGVSDELLSFSNGSIVIPQIGMIKSLNISVACAVVLYEAFRQKQLAGHYTGTSLSADRLGQLYKEWCAK